MRACRTLLLIGAMIGALDLVPATGGPADAGFERLKSLAGEWEGKTHDGHAVSASFRLVSGGTALIEQMSVGDMITVYYHDGDTLMLTHYCEGNNQPRMRAERFGPDSRSIEFKFLDVTNREKATDAIMRSLAISFQDPDHMKEEWVSGDGGKEAPMVIRYTRKR